MLIDRADNAINICEMKYYDGLYSLTNKDIEDLQRKRNVFQQTTQTKKQLFITLITTQGLVANSNSYLIDKHLDFNVLFLCERF